MSKNMVEEIDNKVTQLRKGILELAIMAALYHQTHYGYSLVRNLAGSGPVELKEGTIYPILARLAREELVHSEWMESSQGPPRKYYSLTVNGRFVFESLQSEFQGLVKLVENASSNTTEEAKGKKTKKVTIRRNKDE
ncbi:MAG: PadR family transcriptional regulator [Candidatus Aminicenantes bacterium]|nr:PadR family transcriptional regulator [Candidatus Aminicenantes bacterium]